MIDTLDTPGDSPSTSSRPQWAPRGNHFVVDVLLILAFGGVFDTVLTDRLAISPVVASGGVIALIVLAIGAPWWAALAQQRPKADLPPIVPMEHSSPLRRLYRRFGWVPLVPPIALGVASEMGFRLNGLSTTGEVATTIAMGLAPLAYIYWSGDRYR